MNEPTISKRGVRLLDVDPDLGALIAKENRDEARRSIVLPLAELSPGPAELEGLARLPVVRGRLQGILLADGLLSTTVEIDSRAHTKPLLAGGIVWLATETRDTLALDRAWTVHEPTRAVLLEDRFLAACARWPRLLEGVIARLAAQDERSLRSNALGRLPRVEARLLGLLWEFADQRGRVTSDGIYLELPFTQELLGRMIGARRPTVSLGFQLLQDEGCLRASGQGWILAADSVRRLTPDSAAWDVSAPVPRRAGKANLVLILTDQPKLWSRATGPRIDHVHDEASAVAALAATSPDIVVIALRRSGGEAVLHHIRRHARNVPLILVQPRRGRASALLVDGADAVLDADADELAILSCIQELVATGDQESADTASDSK